MIKRLKKLFLTILGDIKIFKYPMFVVYCPTTYRVKGTQTREAIDLLQPGDLVLRGYNEYLDGFFIPGAYSHTGIYTGEGKVIHAIAEGVSYIDIIDFLRCDRFCILRPTHGANEAIAAAHAMLGRPYDFEFTGDNIAMYCHELAASAYSHLSVEKLPVSFKGIVFNKMEYRYLADSFIMSPDFTTIMEF